MPLNEIETQLLVTIFTLDFDVLFFVMLLDTMRLGIPVVTLGALLRVVWIQLTRLRLRTAFRQLKSLPWGRSLRFVGVIETGAERLIGANLALERSSFAQRLILLANRDMLLVTGR